GFGEVVAAREQRIERLKIGAVRAAVAAGNCGLQAESRFAPHILQRVAVVGRHGPCTDVTRAESPKLIHGLVVEIPIAKLAEKACANRMPLFAADTLGVGGSRV